MDVDGYILMSKLLEGWIEGWIEGWRIDGLKDGGLMDWRMDD